MQNVRPLTGEELVRNVQSKLVKAGLDCNKYQRQLKDIASLFEPERSRVELIAEGARAGSWDMFCYFKGIRHCFHSAREVAATFGIPVVRTDVVKRKRDDEDAGQKSEARFLDDDIFINKLTKSEPPKKKIAALKKSGRMGSRFQNQKLVKAINAHVGMEVSCGNLRARLVSANLGGMTFELLDDHGRPTGDMVPPSQLAKRSCLAHQNNAWKSIKVDGITLDAWVCRLQDEVEAEDGNNEPGMQSGMQAAMYMRAVDDNKGPRRVRSNDDDTATADDDDDYGSGADSEQQRSYSEGRQEAGLKLLSGAALQRPRYNGQHADSTDPARGQSGKQGDIAPGLPGSADLKGESLFGNAPVAEALLQLQQSRAALGDDPIVLHQQLHQAHETILSLNEENKQLRTKRDRLEQLIAQKNQEIAESMKSLLDARREASSDTELAEKIKAQLEEQLAAEHSARLDAEAQLAELVKYQNGDKVLKLNFNVVDTTGGPTQSARVAKLEELLSKTIQTLHYLLHEVEVAGITLSQ